MITIQPMTEWDITEAEKWAKELAQNPENYVGGTGKEDVQRIEGLADIVLCLIMTIRQKEEQIDRISKLIP